MAGGEQSMLGLFNDSSGFLNELSSDGGMMEGGNMMSRIPQPQYGNMGMGQAGMMHSPSMPMGNGMNEPNQRIGGQMGHYGAQYGGPKPYMGESMGGNMMGQPGSRMLSPNHQQPYGSPPSTSSHMGSPQSNMSGYSGMGGQTPPRQQMQMGQGQMAPGQMWNQQGMNNPGMQGMSMGGGQGMNSQGMPSQSPMSGQGMPGSQNMPPGLGGSYVNSQSSNNPRGMQPYMGQRDFGMGGGGQRMGMYGDRPGGPSGYHQSAMGSPPPSSRLMSGMLPASSTMAQMSQNAMNQQRMMGGGANMIPGHYPNSSQPGGPSYHPMMGQNRPSIGGFNPNMRPQSYDNMHGNMMNMNGGSMSQRYPYHQPGGQSGQMINSNQNSMNESNSLSHFPQKSPKKKKVPTATLR